ncbi:unnamed protein product [Mesocestoides corti]|uniref:Not1 domain-containing protein n=1 Tax=Mesocestoides corti TaxID=53468 RepID=A0A0R3URQ2_MESCO|nr:unnamed protein product [Mesocestoides corti]
MMNLLLYMCITAVKSLRESEMPRTVTAVAHTPQMDIIQRITICHPPVCQMCSGYLISPSRYLLLNCMAIQLRYPNSHAYYFSNTLLYQFAEQSKEQMKELISRVLMESGA